MEQEVYKKLYYHAFNRYTELLEQVQKVQQELEELYICLEEEDERGLEQRLNER